MLAVYPIFGALAFVVLGDFGKKLFPDVGLTGLPSEYNFNGVYPLTDWFGAVSFCVFYLVSIFALRAYMSDKKALDLYYFRVAHNALLCFGSFVMVLSMVRELFYVYLKDGFDGVVCDPKRIQLQGQLYFWFYVFYLSKFYEFLDTYILILRKKPITFLHCFHHFVTALLCLLGLKDEFAMQWVIICMNATTHVFMYYYYLAQTVGEDVWWKQYLTSGQMVQFVLDIIFSSYYFYVTLVQQRECSGHPYVLAINDAILISFLILFGNFYFQSYVKKKKTH